MKKFTLIIVGAFFVSMFVFSQQKTITLNLRNVTVKEALEALKTTGGYSYWFDSKDLNINQKVSINVVNKSIHEVLVLLLKGQKVEYKIKDGHIVISKSVEKETPVQKKKELKKVSGIVLDEQGLPVIGASVIIPGSKIAVITDVNGKFSLEAPSDSKLRISYIGYEPKVEELKVNSELKISLEQSPKGLDEVVVVGYGIQKKATLTGAVSSMESKKLLQSPVANISNAMVGRVSGLLATQSSGAPGLDQSSLRIRGIGTFSGDASPLILVDGIEVQNFNNIDANEIESISVLKDASSTAVYGVRGANGVVLVNTKRGKIGKPEFSFTSQVAVSQFAIIRQNADAFHYAEGFNQALKYDSYVSGGYTPKYSESDIEHYRTGDDPLFHPNTDWIKLMFKPSTTQTQHNLNINGGTENVKYFVSFGYFTQGGLYNDKIYKPGYNTENRYSRTNFRSNLDFKISKRLNAKINISTQIQDLKGVSGDGGANTQSPGYLLAEIFGTPPTTSPGVWDGKVVNTAKSGIYINPLIKYYGNGLIANSILNTNGLLRFNYDLDYITKGLSTHLQLSYQNMNSVYTTNSKSLVVYNAQNLNNGNYTLVPITDEKPFGFSQVYAKRRKIDEEFGFDYSRSFGNHNIGGLFVYTQTKTYDPTLQYDVPNGYQGLVGRVTYNYKNRYLAEFNAGYNGTENFAPGKRFGFFPAYSLGWVVSDEPFFKINRNTISFIKLRGSYGEVGNDKIGGNRFLYVPTSYQFYNANDTSPYAVYGFGEVGSTYNPYARSYEGTIGNPDLTWERAKKLDVGVDLTILNDKIRLTLDYFSEKRDNILATYGTIPDLIGTSLPASNLGTMKNGGWDGEITYSDIIGKSFNYWLKGIITLTHNIVEYKDEVNKMYSYQKETGQRFGQLYGLVVEGRYNSWEEVNDVNRPVSEYNANKIQPGDFKYKDINGDGIINDFDKVPIGYSSFPEKTFGFSFGFNYKGLDFSVLFQGVTDFSHLTSKKNMRGWQDDGSAQSYLLDRSWTFEKYQSGITTDFPHISSSSQVYNYQTNTFWVEDASFIRLKNLELGYTLSSVFVKRLGIQSVRFYITGNNLYTWSHMFPGEDPEIPTYSDVNYEPYPITKTFNTGVNIKF